MISTIQSEYYLYAMENSGHIYSNYMTEKSVLNDTVYTIEMTKMSNPNTRLSLPLDRR